MNIAIASSDGITVDEHFGKATRFHIFDVTPEAFNLITIRHIDEAYSTGDKNHSFNQERFTAIANELRDCQKIFVTKIGTAPAKAFKDIGIEPIEYKGPISNIE